MVCSWKYNLARRANIYFLFTTTVSPVFALINVYRYVDCQDCSRSLPPWFSLLPRQQVQARS